MQTTVQSLEELARQSRINYSVVADSPYMEYFVNMAGAEDELYKKWKVCKSLHDEAIKNCTCAPYSQKCHHITCDRGRCSLF